MQTTNSKQSSLYRSSISLLEPVLRLYARIQASRLCGLEAPASRFVGQAIRDALMDEITPEERKWIARIETLRAQLNASETEVLIARRGEAEVPTSIGQICRGSSLPYFWSVLLLKLVRNLEPLHCIELGTCLGISTAFQAAALHLNRSGRIVTLEGMEPLAALALNHVRGLGQENVTVVAGAFQDTLRETLENYKPIDFAFIDGDHREQSTITYFEQALKYLADPGVMVFDDITWSPGMKRAWKAIEADARVPISINMRKLGIAIIDSAVQDKKRFLLPLI
jgi:predicted O-methyltransferase YrrM